MSQKTLSAFGETDDFFGVRTHPQVPAESEILTLAQNENRERSNDSPVLRATGVGVSRILW